MSEFFNFNGRLVKALGLLGGRFSETPASPSAGLRRVPLAGVKKQGAFTLIELLIVVAVLGILASIALPSYKNYVTKSRAQAATSDLVGMSLALENTFQKTLSFPSAYATETTIPALTTSRTASTGLNDFSGWSPAQGNYFSYSVVTTSASYTVRATGNGSAMSGSCVLSLSNENVRSVSADNSCGFTSW